MIDKKWPGLDSARVTDIYQAKDGTIWFSALNAGIAQYDGQAFTCFTKKDGLISNDVNAIYQDNTAKMWFGTTNAGVAIYDGESWSSIDSRDLNQSQKVGYNSVEQIIQDADGLFWFITKAGPLRYVPSPVKPALEFDSVVTDQEYTDFTNSTPFTAQINTNVTVNFSSIDLNTSPEKRQYRYRIKGLDNDWVFLKEHRFNRRLQEKGWYTVEVQAIDRDLNYSETETIVINVMPPWYLNGWIMVPFSGGILILIVFSIVSGWRYQAQRRETQQLRDQMLAQERQNNEALTESYDNLKQAQNQLVQIG